MKLTNVEKILIGEIKYISRKIGFGLEKLDRYSDEDRLFHLKWSKKLLIISAVIIDYTFIEEELDRCISYYFFGRKKSLAKLWQTRKYRDFIHFVMEKLFLQKKYELIKNIYKVPKDINENIYKLNELRNAIVHSFFPEKLKNDKTIYKGKSIFSLEGFKIYDRDVNKIRSYFSRRI